MAPDDLIDRLREGKVYVPQQAERATQHFFQKGNLIALRELALPESRRGRGRIAESQLRHEHKIEGTWAVSERLLVCIGPSPMSPRLVRAAPPAGVRLAAPGSRPTWNRPRRTNLRRQTERLNHTIALAFTVGGQDRHAQRDERRRRDRSLCTDRNVTRIIVGKSLQPRWKELLRGSLVYELTRRSGDIDVYVTSGDTETDERVATPPAEKPEPLSAYLYTVAVIAICTAIGWLMFRRFATTNIVMVYLVGIVAVSLRFGHSASGFGIDSWCGRFQLCFCAAVSQFCSE